MTCLLAHGLSVDLQILDNKASSAYKEALTFKWKATFQFVPPDTHCCNLAECTICTFKDHFLVGAALENFPHESLKKTFLVPCMQPKLGKGAAPKVAYSQLPPLPISPISSNAIFFEIDPHGKELAINIPQAHGFGNAVDWGHHLCMPLRCQNCKLSTPIGEKSPRAKKNSATMTNLPLSSAEVTSRNE
jgi:hypothetical protein